ncbi:hypothetical protein E4U33_000663 [Claviceps sp. LM78 group G4]|nr:hypothetical protein E4U33_000663 [Claviceps sp. LM78 group G4]
MPLPTTKPVQSSIRSFFTSSTPNYAPPPGQSPPPPPPAPPSPPPPPPSTLKQQTQQQEVDQQEKDQQEKDQQEQDQQEQDQQEQDQQEQDQQEQDQQEQDQQAQKQLQEEHQRQEEQDQQKHQQPNIPLPSPPSKSTIPPSATIRIPTEADLPPFRRINALLLQVAYTESYYASTLHNPLARIITWSHDGQAPKVVGAVVCLIEDDDANTNTNAHDPQSDETQRPQTLYLRSMCLLAPYRGLGLAQAALEDILEGVRHRNVNVVSITAHVWTENEDGLRWYKGRGFKKDSVKPLEGYYLRLRPGTAWLVRKILPEDGAAQNGGLSGQRNGSGKGEGEGEERGVVIPESVTAAVVNMPPPSPPAVHAAAAAAATAAASSATSSATSSVATTIPASGPPSTPTPGTRPTPMSGQSFQNQRPEMEWNDLPEDMAPPRASALRGKAAGEAASGAAGAGSRGASAGGKKKRDRSYPAAAFGSQN